MRLSSFTNCLMVVVALLLAVHAPQAQPAQFGTGALIVADPWTPPPPPSSPAGAVFLTLINRGATPARLMGGSTPVAARVELHSMTIDGGVMRMRRLDQGLVVPAGGRVDLRPGGLHIMLVGLRMPVVAGRSYPMTLVFEGGARVDVVVRVGRR